VAIEPPGTRVRQGRSWILDAGKRSREEDLLPEHGSRAVELASRLDQAVAKMLALLESVRPEVWSDVPAAGVWSIGKDVEHMIEAAGYHQWIVRLTIGEPVSSRRPTLERERLTTELHPLEAFERMGRSAQEGRGLILGLTDDQLALPTRPPRARAQALADTIERVLIGHYDAHRRDIEVKLRA
jgi:DinB superfamily